MLKKKLVPITHLRWLWLSIVIIVLDQSSKWFVLQQLTFHHPVIINPFFNWDLAFNQGAAFSFLAQSGGWQLWLFNTIAVVISLGIVAWLMRPRLPVPLQAIGLCLILGGALGNVIDRLRLHKVVDFISWHVGQYYWPTFNVADSAVCIGVVLFMIGSRDERKSH